MAFGYTSETEEETHDGTPVEKPPKVPNATASADGASASNAAPSHSPLEETSREDAAELLQVEMDSEGITADDSTKVLVMIYQKLANMDRKLDSNITLHENRLNEVEDSIRELKATNEHDTKFRTDLNAKVNTNTRHCESAAKAIAIQEKALRSIEYEIVEREIKVKNINFDNIGNREWPKQGAIIDELTRELGMDPSAYHRHVTKIRQLGRAQHSDKLRFKTAPVILTFSSKTYRDECFHSLRNIDKKATKIRALDAVPDRHLDKYSECWTQAEEWRQRENGKHFMVKMRRDRATGFKFAICTRNGQTDAWKEIWTEPTPSVLT